MKTSTKIRWLLFLVTLGLFATSLTARWASTQLIKLYDIADDISDRLAQKEKEVYRFLAQVQVGKLKDVVKDPQKASKILNHFSDRDIFFQIYQNNHLVFWSDAVISASNPKQFKEGASFENYSTASYEVIKKTDGDVVALFFIPIKSQLPFRNQYLNNDDSKDFVIRNAQIEIAGINDANVIDIKNKDGKYLFSIKKASQEYQIPYTGIEILMWAFGMFTLLLLINSVCKYYADSGYPLLAWLGLGIVLVILRYLGLAYHFPPALYSLHLFNPALFASNFYFPSFADLLLNVFFLLWFVAFAYSYKNRLFKPIKNKFIGLCIFIYSAFFIALLSFVYSDVFFGLVFNSNINFKVSNLINLNYLSFLGIFAVMVALLCYYLMIDLLVNLTVYIELTLKTKKIALLVLLLTFIAFTLSFHQSSVFYVLVFSLILISIKVNYQPSSDAFLPAIVLIAFIFATIVSLKLNAYETFKQQEIKKTLLLKISGDEDPNASIAFNELEKNIITDLYLSNLLTGKSENNTRLNAHISKYYLTDYLSKFDYKAYLYNQTDSLVSAGQQVDILKFKQQVENSALKVSNYFYKLNNTFGYQSYFAIIPIKKSGVHEGTLVLELNSKRLSENGAFPQLMQNGNVNQNAALSGYSYAFYQNRKLVSQNGFFIYDLINPFGQSALKKFMVLNKNGFEHLIYKPTTNTTVVVTSEASTFWRELASLSFFFIIFFVFALLVSSYKWLFIGFGSYTLNFGRLRRKILATNNKILYKTRIQVALVLAVVSSSLIIGIITFSYISIQYKQQQEDFIKSRIRTISDAFEDSVFSNSDYFTPQTGIEAFEQFSKLYNTDLNFYDVNGRLIYSTQYKIYAVGLAADRMNPTAYLNLKIKQKSEFIQDEAINQLKFTSAYMPIKNKKNNVIAYLGLPYFANQDDYNQKIGTFLNLLINIYVLVFVVIGFFAFVVANQITSPLSLIQESFSQARAGWHNTPIRWKRDDEIGSLIAEYNAMLEALEENANKLAQNERETAWREMAKQVAHEIKNPLTPLRLGIQMLDRAWREKDEQFDAKFQKFSKSFLEQIDSLSRIASEFSNFAKMPELKLERVNLLEVINKAIEVFSQMEHIQINCDEAALSNCFIRADKDQLLRSFNNLLKNAIEAVADGKDGIINISGQQGNGKVEIRLSDNGSGIPVNSRSNIFVPNFTTKSSGTGLGLAFVKQAIQNINGNIYFTTEIDVGTTFYITLPVVS
ncbi:histidine kinase [Pelobium manganitolerans]|uniref:histidine kinase n=1 Tax=Pelobium manganitolerans TaxID=1842495 RepID=A0A419SA17_9SPHI|nr:ATP-binding protein [Pelobium manganitolerans]RKD19070.1 histidine kinase [Pelobium manganitolerans]